MTTSTDIIEAIQDKLDDMLESAGGAAIEWGIGATVKAKHKTPPTIIWDDSDIAGEIAPLKRSSMNPRRLAADVDRYKVRVWHIGNTDGDARANVQRTLHNLIVATRELYGVETVRFGSYAKTADGQERKGVTLTVDVEIELIVTRDIWATPTASFDGQGVVLPSEETPFDPPPPPPGD